jgi:hypothetical protein
MTFQILPQLFPLNHDFFELNHGFCKKNSNTLLFSCKYQKNIVILHDFIFIAYIVAS